jgi:hypothetical protein
MLLFERVSVTAIASSFRLDKVLAGVPVDRVGMDTVIGIFFSPSAHHLSQPMHILSSSVILDCQYDKSSAVYSSTMNFLLLGFRYGHYGY